MMLFAGMGCLLASACGGSGTELVPVTGKALYKGEPMVGAKVFFAPKQAVKADVNTVAPAAEVGEDGSFEVMTQGEKGAAPGEYTVTFFWAGQPGAASKKSRFKGGAGEGPGPNLLPPNQIRRTVTITTETEELEPFRLP